MKKHSILKLAFLFVLCAGFHLTPAPQAQAGVSFGFAVGGPRWGVAVGHTPAHRYYGPRYAVAPRVYAPTTVVVRPNRRAYRPNTVVYGGRRNTVVVRGAAPRPYHGRRVVVW